MTCSPKSFLTSLPYLRVSRAIKLPLQGGAPLHFARELLLYCAQGVSKHPNGRVSQLYLKSMLRHTGSDTVLECLRAFEPLSGESSNSQVMVQSKEEISTFDASRRDATDAPRRAHERSTSHNVAYPRRPKLFYGIPSPTSRLLVVHDELRMLR